LLGFLSIFEARRVKIETLRISPPFLKQPTPRLAFRGLYLR